MSGRTDWPKASGNPVAIKPPPFKRLPGRPVTQRRKKKDEPNKDKDDGPNLSRKAKFRLMAFVSKKAITEGPAT
ncbi:hypothetical protein COLO4_24719 [Corchorus olitorius]|uniref:Uncharacterized protein n=1 Tax=Corchorus olitorius TaxID=93759 RepID=A0A1R3I7R6_9ROSI|nr:hypothetical protein COLO4_24719 [Corchorus olitorius]